jgi:hypothetical protein
MSRHEQRRRLSALHDGTILRDGESVPVSDNGFGYLKCRAGHETFKVHKIVAEELLGRSGLVDFPRIAELLTDAGQWDVAHKDGNKHNNRVENLMWCPHLFNMAHESKCPAIEWVERWMQKPRLPCGQRWCRPAARMRARVGRAAWARTDEAREAYSRVGEKLRGRPSPLRGVTRENAHMRGNRFAPRKLDALQVAEIRNRAKQGESHRSLGRAFGVCATTVDRIVRGLKWKSVEPAASQGVGHPSPLIGS